MDPTPYDLADRLIVALDYPSSEAALNFVDRLEGRVRWFKIGLELYLAAGLTTVHTLRSRGFYVFLDLKLHDIPNTVAGAVRALAGSGASLLTVHAAGGPAMLAAAQDATSPECPRLLAVTVLTSMDQPQLASVGIASSPADQVSRLGRLAFEAGLAGVICSPEETSRLRDELGSAPLLVVPGIRPANHNTGTDDQRRIATPATALHAGASFLVIGRPITQASDPAAAVDRILAEMRF